MKLSVYFLLLATCIVFTNCAEKPSEKIKVIFDTDFGGDADDLGALAMLNHFQNRGEIDLLAVMCWNTEKYAVSGIDATNTYYGNPDIPVGRRVGVPHETPRDVPSILRKSRPSSPSCRACTWCFRE